jgi:hypothetical protein
LAAAGDRTPGGTETWRIQKVVSVTTFFSSTTLLVGGSRDRSPVVSLGIFSVATDGTMCPGVESASKMSTRKTPGGEGGRCVRVTTYHLHSAGSRENPEALTYRIPKGLLRPVAGQLYLFTTFFKCLHRYSYSVIPAFVETSLQNILSKVSHESYHSWLYTYFLSRSV